MKAFLLDLTEGKLNISKGMVSRLSQEFACKSEQERRKMFSDLLLSPVMHTGCTTNIQRQLKDSMENEPGRTWNKQMHTLIREMIHYRNSLEPGNGCDKEEIAKFEAHYGQIVEKVKEEYEYIPDINNEAERLLRGYKFYLI